MCSRSVMRTPVLQGKMTHELASTTKAWTTLRGREVVSLGRELLGGNGVVADFLVSHASCCRRTAKQTPKAIGHPHSIPAASSWGFKPR